MTRHAASLTSLLFLVSSLPAAPEAPAPRPAGGRMADLVERLGSPDYVTRELATRELELVGPLALPALQKALSASADGEVVRRAGLIASRIEKRLADDKALAPTLVTLPADRALAEVLADLSRQTGYQVRLTGQADSKRVYSFKAGRRTFWDAVEHVCRTADLQIASVGGFAAQGASPSPAVPGMTPGVPGVMPPIDVRRQRYGRPMPDPANPTNAIVLEPRRGARRPGANVGAVRLETLPLPPGTPGLDGVTALVQVWAEPKLRWEQTRGVRVRQARDDRGQALAPDLTAESALAAHVVDGNGMFVNGGGALVINGGNVVIQGNVRFQGNVVIQNGNLIVNGETPEGATTPGSFVPNAMQAVVRLQAGERPSDWR